MTILATTVFPVDCKKTFVSV